MHKEARFEDVLCPFNLSLCHTMAKAHPTCVHTVYLEGEGSVSTCMHNQEVYFNSSVKNTISPFIFQVEEEVFNGHPISHQIDTPTKTMYRRWSIEWNMLT